MREAPVIGGVARQKRAPKRAPAAGGCSSNPGLDRIGGSSAALTTEDEQTASLKECIRQSIRVFLFERTEAGVPINLVIADVFRTASEVIAETRTVSTSALVLDSPASTSTQREQASHRYQLRRAGDYWSLVWDSGEQFQLRDTKGLQDIARLLQRPHESIWAATLASVAPAALGESSSFEDGLEPDNGRGVPAIDEQGITALRRCLADIGEEIAAATDRGAVAEVEELKETEEKLTSHLSAATNKNGRPRLTSGSGEKARTCVTNRIRRAIQTVRQTSPSFADHLDRYIETGSWVVYDPPETLPWEF